MPISLVCLVALRVGTFFFFYILKIDKKRIVNQSINVPGIDIVMRCEIAEWNARFTEKLSLQQVLVTNSIFRDKDFFL